MDIFEVPLVVAAGISATFLAAKKQLEKYKNRIKDGLIFVSGTTPYDNNIRKYASEYNIDTKILKALLYWESNFNPNKVSKDGAMGLGQIMPKTWNFVWKDIIKSTPPSAFHPESSIRASAAYLRYLLNKFNNNYSIALMSYNAGETDVRAKINRYGNTQLVIGAMSVETQQYLYGISELHPNVNV